LIRSDSKVYNRQEKYISNKCCSFEFSIYQNDPEKNASRFPQKC